ncbi:MAG: uroporphyrinogen decarboxylase family protein [Candidatus Hodarchaeota archaeon]
MYDWNSRIERVSKALLGAEVDRPPFLIMAGEQMISRVMGCTIHDLYNDGKYWAKATIKTQEFFSSDVPYVCLDPALLNAEAFGATFIHRKYLTSTATPEDRLIKTPEDVDKLEIPDYSKAGLYPELVKAFKYLQEYTHSPVIDGFFFSDLTWGPIQQLRGDKAWMDFYMNPDLLPKLAKKIYEGNLALLEYWRKELWQPMIDLNIAYLGNKDMASYKDFWEIEGKWIKKFRQKTGMGVVLHNCGRQPYWEGMIKDIRLLGVQATFDEFGNSDVNYWKEMKKKHNIYVIGTLNQTGSTLIGTPEDVEKEVIANLEALTSGGRFILSHGCEVGWGIPLENIMAVKTGVEKFSKMANK